MTDALRSLAAELDELGNAESGRIPEIPDFRIADVLGREQPFPSPGDLSSPGIEPRSPVLQAGSLPAEPQGKPMLSI